MVAQVQTNDTQEEIKYLTYNGMSRKPTFWGIPLIPFITLFFPLIMSLLIGIRIFGLIKGLIIPLILASILIFIKIKCTNDSNALVRLFWVYRGIIYRFFSGSIIVSFSCANKKINRKKLNEFFRQSEAKKR